MKNSEAILGGIEQDIWIVKRELLTLAFLVKGLQEAEGGGDLFGLGLILERHAKTLDSIEEKVLKLLKQ